MFPVDQREIVNSIKKGSHFLIEQQFSDGRFEGILSSMTFPTCALAWVQIAQGNSVSSPLINWLEKQRLTDNQWALDTSRIPNQNATEFAQLILSQTTQTEIPPKIPQLGLIKLAYAHLKQLNWSKVIPPPIAIFVVRTITTLLPQLSKWVKPPRHLLPSPDFFYSAKFKKLFVAEKQTLVPCMILIETHTKNRRHVITDLLDWMFSCRLADGSWFRVNYITALSALAMIEAKKHFPELVKEDYISTAISWLEQTQNLDGGCREALNLNVWDTALSTIALAGLDNENSLTKQLQASSRWIMKQQSNDGGWAFSGLADFRTSNSVAKILSDADDTALSTLALILSLAPHEIKQNQSIKKGIGWLVENQSPDGSWSTYVPGEGDMGCTSITAHAIETLLAFGGYEPQINKGVDWLRKTITPEGYWSDLWLSQFTYGTSCAIVALAKAGYADCIEVRQGKNWLELAQNENGGWGEDMFGRRLDHSTVEQTAWSTYALLQTTKEEEISPSIKRGLRFLLDQQNHDGSWPTSCVGIYWEIIGGYEDPIYSSVFPLLALNSYYQKIVC